MLVVNVVVMLIEVLEWVVYVVCFVLCSCVVE